MDPLGIRKAFVLDWVKVDGLQFVRHFSDQPILRELFHRVSMDNDSECTRKFGCVSHDRSRKRI
jgi:hypothetical protein